MSVLTGGIFSNPSGKTGGVVFGAARTRTGKKVTSRLLVPPSNPNTAAQQTQRNKFKEALAIVRLLGTSIYQSIWNRAIGQLPGFQSMMNVFLTSINSVFEITTIPPINLGSLHMADSISLGVTGDPGSVVINFSTENGLNGNANDDFIGLVIETDPAATPLERLVKVSADRIRSEGIAVVEGFTSGENVSVLGYFKGQGPTAGMNSPTGFAQGLVIT